VSRSQDIIDQVVAVVGNEIILKSEIENQYIQYLSQGLSGDGDFKCEILEDMMFQKLLLIQAEVDSIEVTNKEVNMELDRRLNMFISQFGSEKDLEKYYGKTIAEIKNDFYKIIKNQLLTQRAQASITANVRITPSEVKTYYETIPKDSLPIIDSYFELSEIVISPKISKEEKDATKQKLSDIRERIINGESFSTLAILYSEDIETASKGGELGFASRTDYVPEFSSIAFNLTSTNEVSRIVETEFGFHIIQLVEKRGNMANFRHILLIPKGGIEELQIAEQKADSIYNLIMSNSTTFEQVAFEHNDSETRLNNGKIMNQYHGNSRLNNDLIHPYMRRAIVNLKPGEITTPFLGTNNKGAKVIMIVRLDTKVDQHIANLNDDYQDLQNYATQIENQKTLTKWLNEKIGSTYIRVDQSYDNCDFKFADWKKEKREAE
jgi:peptidyl-prolyl cis-trans isomerase SurA